MAASVGVGVMNGASAVVWPAPDYRTAAASIRELFRFLGLDTENPLRQWIQPGMTVVIKPNWVKHEFGSNVGRDVLYTHESLVRVVIDAVLKAVNNDGRVIVADAPLQGCDFNRLRRQGGIARMEADYARAPITFLDLRRQWAEIDDASSYVRAVHPLAGDPLDYSLIDLEARSRLACFGANMRFGVTDYCAGNTNGHHHGGHRYLVSNSVLSADVIVNVPKLKTHIKTGMTGALKNFVGIIGAKDCLPHFREGCPANGGDEYPDGSWLSRAANPLRETLQARAPLWLWRLARAGVRAASSAVISGGGWHGNDTLWRTVHDLVDIARNYNPTGASRPRSRTILTLVDAIVAGEDRGPLKPRPKPCGLLVWGEDPGIVDVACASVMGFDWRRIPLLSHLCDAAARTISGFSGELTFQAPSADIAEFVHSGGRRFTPPPGWADQIPVAR